MWVQHSHIDLELDAWCVSLKSCLHTAADILKNELLLAIYAVSHYLINTLKNNTGNKVSGDSFLTDSHNQLNAVNDWLFHCLHTDSHLLTQYFHFSISDAFSNIASQESAINSYLHANQHFLHVLTCLIYMGSSLSLHCKKLVTISWVNQETAQNIFLWNHSVVIVTDYHKTQWCIRTCSVMRFLFSAVRELLIHYLIYISPFLHFLNHCVQCLTLHEFLFLNSDSIWISD